MMQYGRYAIVKELGKGNMGVVYQAHDPQIDRMVALKVLRADRVTSEDFVARFFKEARAIGRLSHPHIVTVYDVGEDHGTVYIAMEYLDGEALNDVMQKKSLTQQECIDIVLQVAEALDYAHNAGIVHRDIKPSNIMLTPDNRVKLTDFGIARIEDSTAGYQTQAGEILGTPIYMSPEQVTGKRADARSDLYALGVLLYEMLLGRRPFTGSNLGAIFHAITTDTPDAPAAVDPHVSHAMSNVIMQCLEKAPDRRYQTGRQFIDAVRGLQRQPAGGAVPGGVAARKRRFKAPLAAVLMLAGLLAAGIYYFKPAAEQGAVIDTAGSAKPAQTTPADPAAVETQDATLAISSEPQGAAIYVDSLFVGKSPLDLQLPLGKHELRLSLENHLAWEAQVNVDTPGTMPLHVSLRKSE